MKSTDVLRTGVQYAELKALLRARVAISFLFPSIKQTPASYGAHTEFGVVAVMMMMMILKALFQTVMIVLDIVCW